MSEGTGRPSRRASILVVDDDATHRDVLQAVLESWGFTAEGAADGEQAVERAREAPFDLILMDVRMAGLGGIEAMKRIRAYNPSIPVLVMTAYSSVESAVEALKAGAYDYLTKPLDFDVLRLTMERALEHTSLKSENLDLKRKLHASFHLDKVIGKSRSMRELIDMLAMVAPSEATVLITGESGTGKELIAKAVHYNSDRKDGPLVIVNCAAITETLLESELFGHEKGAFTDARKRRDGYFMQADGGTIFLDEIGEMSPLMQAKLLRVIQEREIHRVGGEETLKVDVRLVTATNRNLEEEVVSGRFREDLYYRLKVVQLHVPPLREREEDIPLLAHHFLQKYAEKNRRVVKGFTPGAMDTLLKHPWPGNVRELENTVERAVILLRGDYVTERELPFGMASGPASATGSPVQAEIPAEGRSLEEIEREAILATLESTGGNKSEAARRLGITRKTLLKKLRKYGR